MIHDNPPPRNRRGGKFSARSVAVLQAPVERRVGQRVAARVVGVVEFIESPVEVAAREELLVRAALAQLAVVEDEYLVGALDGREAVRDDDGGAGARAKEMSCFWPTESPAPRSRTSDLKPSGRRSMKPSACTSRAAQRTRSSDTSSRPRRMLPSTVPLKRNTSWRTTAKFSRSAFKSHSRTSTPSSSTCPRCTS